MDRKRKQHATLKWSRVISFQIVVLYLLLNIHPCSETNHLTVVYVPTNPISTPCGVLSYWQSPPPPHFVRRRLPTTAVEREWIPRGQHHSDKCRVDGEQSTRRPDGMTWLSARIDTIQSVQLYSFEGSLPLSPLHTGHTGCVGCQAWA